MNKRWRKFFDGAGADIWTVIEHALDIAALDFPDELRTRRDGFAEKLFAPSSRKSKPGDCDGGGRSDVINAPIPKSNGKLEEDFEEDRHGPSDNEDLHADGTCEYDEAEALTDEIEEESRQMQQILGLKDSIADTTQTEEELLRFLQRLQEMNISVEALKATEIGKEVNALRKHGSKRVRSLVKSIVKGWKELVDEWVKSAGDVAAASLAESGSDPTEHEEDGLPSPPLDPGALLAAARTASLEMSQFFDDLMDDDISAGSGPSPPSSNGISEEMAPPSSKREQRDRVVRASSPDSLVTKGKNSVFASDSYEADYKVVSSGHKAADGMNGISRTANGLSHAAGGSSGPGKPLRKTLPPKGGSNGVVRKSETRPSSSSGNKPKVEPARLQAEPEDMSVAARLEAAKRRLHERYQEAENAKRQRVVQVMDLTELPKGGPARARGPQSHFKPAGLNRNWSHGRR